MKQQLKLAYLAGLFDGEGCVMIRKAYGRNSPIKLSVMLGNTNRPLVEIFKSTFGGAIFVIHRKDGDIRATVWQWTIVCRAAGQALEALLPYLIGKKQEAEIAIALQKRISAKMGRYSNKLSGEELELRENMRLQILAVRKSIKVRSAP